MAKLILRDHYTYQDILLAHRDCIKRKRRKYVAFVFDTLFDRNLVRLLDEINDGTYEIGPSRGFVSLFPKVREVWAAQYRDRVVHHLLYRDIAPFYLSQFIHANAACIKGKGTDFAANLCGKYLRSATEDWTKPAWIFQFDIHNFFVSINRALLWDILKQDLGDTSLTARLMKQVVFHDPTKGAIVKPGTDFSKVPPHKSLWLAKKGFGLPIGDLTSQLCASGIYLDALDKYVKHVLKCRRYVRYVDDGILVTRDKEEARYWKGAIDEWLRKNRGLRLSKDKSFIAKADAGVNFVGSYILPYRTYTRRLTASSAKKAVHTAVKYGRTSKTLQPVNAYLGLMRHKDTFNLRKKLCARVCLPSFVGTDPEYTKVFRLI